MHIDAISLAIGFVAGAVLTALCLALELWAMVKIEKKRKEQPKTITPCHL